jgi:hypothetical protein
MSCIISPRRYILKAARLPSSLHSGVSRSTPVAMEVRQDLLHCEEQVDEWLGQELVLLQGAFRAES